jgi:SAM-dependent methyltransferase
MTPSRLVRSLHHRLTAALWRARHEALRLRTRDPLLPPSRLHSVGGGDFRTVGDELLTVLVEIGGLRPDERVLDVGCGTGRLARPLTRYLTTGSYDGLDIVASSIAWCAKAYRGHPNFRFHHADLLNRTYNPGGAVAAGDYRFPFGGGAFDFVFLTSVFTHMLARDTQNYLGEIARVLAPGGRALVTAFLLDEDSRRAIEEHKTAFTFGNALNGCFAESGTMPEGSVAYDRAVFNGMIAAAGLGAGQFHRGSWRGADGPTYQDVLVLRAAAG